MEDSNVFEPRFERKITKSEYYKELLGGLNPDALFVLGGGNRTIAKDGRRKRFTTSAYKGKFYPVKTGGAKARPVAVAELAEFYPQATIVTMSHRPLVLFQSSEQTTQPVDQPPFSKVLYQDLQKLGVSNEIIEDPYSTSTLTEIMDVVMLSVENGWRKSTVLTNDYQLERAQKILNILKDDDRRKLLKNQLQFLFATGEETEAFNKKWGGLEESLAKYNQGGYSTVFVSAESVLEMRSPHYASLIRQLREDNGYKNVREQERVGNAEIANFEYNFAQPSFKEYILSSDLT
jgi:hypothetical protein